MGGFSASGATVVIFIGILISAGALIPAIGSVVEQTTDAYTTQQERQVMVENTDFEVDSYWVDFPGAGQDGEYQVNITNTGTTTLTIDTIDYQLDGELEEPEDRWVRETPDDERTFLRPGETLEAEFSLGEEPDRLQVTVETGQSRMVVQ